MRTPSPLASAVYAPASSRVRGIFFVLVFAGFVGAVGANAASAQTLVSDQLDYPPGTVATLSGSGFEPFEAVHMSVDRIDDAPAGVELHWSWMITADESGSFVTTWDVCEQCVGATLRATATGLASGALAQCTFTDATAWSVTLAPGSVTAGQTQAFTFSALNTSTGGGNQMGCITITIPAQFTPVGSPSIVSGSTTHAWSVNRVGQVVTATANSNADRIEQGEGIQISITATAPASTAGSPFTWPTTARSNTNCSGNSFGIPENGSPSVAVHCAAPTIASPGNITVNVDPGQCSAVVSFSAPAAGDPVPSVTYSQDPGTVFPVGTTTVTATASSSCGSANSSFTVTVVDNEAPAIVLAGANPITLECHGPAFSDPGASATDNCPGSIAVVPSGVVDVNTVGSYTIVYSASDPNGNTSTQSRTVNVVDTTNPVVTLNGPAEMTLECHGPAFSDPGASADDSCAGSLAVNVSGSVDVNTVGDYLLTYSASDPSGNSDSETRLVHVVDTTNPVVTLNGPAEMTLECHGPAFSDPGASASDACAGSLAVNVSGSVDVNTVGDYLLTYSATDPSGHSDSQTRLVHVVDTTAPVIGAAGADATIECPNAPVFTPPVANDACEGSVQVNEISDVTSPGACPSSYSRTKSWQAVDASGNASVIVSQTITVVDSTPPAAAITAPPSGSIVCVGSTVMLQGVVSDNCGLQGAQWQLDSIVLPAGSIGAGGVVSTAYTFNAPGVYQIKLTATDACGNATTASLTPEGFEWTIIVFDPNGGFVTGGGWINSPAGAYRPDPSLVGKANFGFVSKYQKGARVPTGETEFQFKAGDLNFHSSSYEWLVVGGARAQYKGCGRINNAGDYGFLLTAIDGGLLGNGSSPDRFRIKIWDRASGGVVYDNQYGQPEDSDASTVLGGGSIVIHNPKGSSLTMASGLVAPALAPVLPAAGLPVEYALYGARPDPFMSSTHIAFDLPEPSEVTIHVYDVRGRKIATVASGSLDAGMHSVSWDGRAEGGQRLTSGIYFARFSARSLVTERRMDSVRKLHLNR